MIDNLIRKVSLEDMIYLKKAVALACLTHVKLDIPRLNQILRDLLND